MSDETSNKNNPQIEDETTETVAENNDDITIEQDENLDDSVVAEESAGETIKKLRAKLKQATEEKQNYLTAWQRDKADFLNARKRDREEMESVRKYATEGIIDELISVLQSFEMAFANKEAWEKADKNWRIGVEYIHSQLQKTLENYGLKEVSPLGKKFDPMRDEAMEYVPVTEENKSDIIVEVIQKGYMLNDKMLRAPKVKVGEFKK